MEQTAIKAGPPPAPVDASSAITAERPRPLVKTKPWPLRCLEVIASLRLTVVLFALSIFLVYYGTWAQKEAGIWTVVNQYFRSFLVWIPLKVVLMFTVDIPGSIPYPGGRLLGSILLANLLAAHAVRFKISWKRSGILLIHSGIILLLLGELVTSLFAVEGHMFIFEGTSANYAEHDRVIELAVVDRSGDSTDNEIIVPGKLLQRGGTVSDNALPFEIEVVEWMGNSDLFDVRGGGDLPGEIPDNPATIGIGLRKVAKPRPETRGVDTEQKVEIPSAYLRFKEKGTGKPLGTYLLSTWFSYLQKPADEIVVDGKRYAIALRYERDYRNYSIQLLRFSHDKYIGTEKAKNYSSLVVVKEGKEDKGRQVLIYMNHPLYFQGETFYQADVHRLAKGTVLQVVRNPGKWMPYIACLLVSVGMLVHFSLHLFGFLKKRFAT